MKKYLLCMFLIFFILFSLLFLTNMYLNYMYYISANPEFEASEWQEKTNGIVAIDFFREKKFKSLRLNQKLKEKSIDTVVCGLSTMMGVNNSMLPKGHALYNYFLSDFADWSPLYELEKISKKEDISHYIVGLDWSVGRLMDSRDIDESSEKRGDLVRISWLDLVRDSLTTVRVKILLNNLWGICLSENPFSAFNKIFFTHNEAYQCPGGLAKDFNISIPGKCAGYYPDGSRGTDFMLSTSLLKKDLPLWKAEVTKESHRFIQSLSKSKGVIPTSVLNKLSKIVKRVKERGADIFFILPPLLPELEKAILETGHKNELLNIKNTLNQFAISHKVHILDAGQSEEYGCQMSEFYDSHHAFPPCYQKILSLFFAKRHKLNYGLIGPELVLPR